MAVITSLVLKGVVLPRRRRIVSPEPHLVVSGTQLPHS
jgi:hypothetical protein